MKKELRNILYRIEQAIRFIEDERTTINRRVLGNSVEITKFTGSELNQLLIAREEIENLIKPRQTDSDN
jgi:hypothetical protein